MLIPSPPIVQPWVVTRTSTVEQSHAVTRMFASLVSTLSFAVRSSLKLLVHSSGEADGITARTTRQIVQIISYLLSIVSPDRCSKDRRPSCLLASCIVYPQLSFISQGDHWIDPGSAACWDKTGSKGDSSKSDRYRDKG